MIFIRSLRCLVGCVVCAALLAVIGPLHAQTTQISTEYLMTLYAPMDPAQHIDDTFFIYNVRNGGWVKGPKINGTIVAPTGDWLRVMPSGVARLDVRLSVRTDDGALIYMTYNGIISHTKESWDRLLKGEVLTAKDHYFLTAPTMQTSSEKYAWVNQVQCIGKVVEVKLGEGSYVKYDIFIVK